jgi:hypothetical protein
MMGGIIQRRRRATPTVSGGVLPLRNNWFPPSYGANGVIIASWLPLSLVGDCAMKMLTVVEAARSIRSGTLSQRSRSNAAIELQPGSTRSYP